jgi:anti-sigma factor RsiW
MHTRYDETELLDLIEGRLDASTAGALEARLASDAPARVMVDRMRADRAALKALPEPELPMDFLAQSEHLLARPMLMDPVSQSMSAKPGQYRRQQQKIRWRVRWPRLAAAAVVVLAAGAGVWQLTVSLWPQRSGESEMLAATDQPADADRSGGAAVDVSSLRGVIYHAVPNERTIALALAGHNASTGSNDTMIANAAGSIVNAEFALVIRTKDMGAAEAAIGDVLKDSGVPVALVRNFNFEEARRLDREWRTANAGSGNSPQPHAVTDVRGSRADQPRLVLKELADHVRQSLQSKSPANASKEPASGCVAGAKELSPTLEQQLELSSRGATHVVVVPVADLQSILGELGLDSTNVTTLRMLPGPASSATPEVNTALAAMPTLEAGLMEGPRVRQAMSQISSHGPHAMVRLPVVVEISDSRR